MMRKLLCLVAALSSVATIAAAPPRPDLTDTFKFDRYLRRTKHPLTVKLIAAGAGGTNVPVTFGLACGEGDFAAGMLQPRIDGKAIPAQVDVLATWARDKSIRHALRSIELPLQAI